MISYIDYVYDIDKAKALIESVLRNHPNVLVDTKGRREKDSLCEVKNGLRR